MTLGLMTQTVRAVFEDRSGQRYISEPVPFGFVESAAGSGYREFGMALVGIKFEEGK